MSSCPNCNNPINEDFGIVECPTCRALLVVEMDGRVRLNESSSEMPPPIPSGLADPTNGLLDGLVQELTSEIDHSFEAPLEDSPPPTPPPPPPLPEQDPISALNEIQSFGNQIDQTGQQGNYMYSLLIRGIDSGDLRDEVLEVLSDKKLRLNTEEIKRKIKNGELRLGPVTSVKASVIVQNLLHLPLFIEWNQHSMLKENLSV